MGGYGMNYESKQKFPMNAGASPAPLLANKEGPEVANTTTEKASFQADCLEDATNEALLYKKRGEVAAAEGPRMSPAKPSPITGMRPRTPATPGTKGPGADLQGSRAMVNSSYKGAQAGTPSTPSASPQGGSAAESFAANYQTRMTEARASNPFGY